MSDSLPPHGLQHTRLPCPPPYPGVCSDSCPLSQWCHPAILSSLVSFSCPQSFPASESCPVSQLFTSGGQSTGASASPSVLPMNIQGWFPLGLTDLTSLQSKELSRVFSNTTVQKHQWVQISLSIFVALAASLCIFLDSVSLWQLCLIPSLFKHFALHLSLLCGTYYQYFIWFWVLITSGITICFNQNYVSCKILLPSCPLNFLFSSWLKVTRNFSLDDMSLLHSFFSLTFFHFERQRTWHYTTLSENRPDRRHTTTISTL